MNLIPARSHTFVEIDREIFSMVVLLIQEGLVSVTSESMCMKHWLSAESKGAQWLIQCA